MNKFDSRTVLLLMVLVKAALGRILSYPLTLIELPTNSNRLAIATDFGNPRETFSQSTSVNHPIDHGELFNRPRSVAQSTSVNHPIDHGELFNRPRSVAQSTSVNHPIDHGELFNRPRSVAQSTSVNQSTDALCKRKPITTFSSYYWNSVELVLKLFWVSAETQK